jgi:hypothetical protein
MMLIGPKKVAKTLTSFIRTQTWISPAPGINEPTDNDPDLDENLNFSPSTLETFEKDPELLLAHRWALMDRRSDNFKRVMRESDLQAKAQEMFTKSMETRLGEGEKGQRLLHMLLPKCPVGCRRQTPGPGFLEALLQDNVDTRWDDIARKGGKELEFDAICCATGFQTSFGPSIPIVGRNGVDLAQNWTSTCQRHIGVSQCRTFPITFVSIPSQRKKKKRLIGILQASSVPTLASPTDL